MKLFVRTWPAPDPSGTICICHGLGEHSGRYERVAQRLNREGWIVVAPDHRGHGNSPGQRGHVARWSDYVEDFHEAISASSDPSLPRAIIGQSMGGLIAAAYALVHQETLRGLVMLSPMLEIGARISPAQVVQARVLSRLLPSYSVPNGLEASALSRDPAVGVAYLADPLVHDRATARWVTEAWAAMADVYRRAAEIQIPVLVCLGDADRITNVARARTYFEQLAVPDRLILSWPGAYHELLHELDREALFEQLVTWLRPRLIGPGSNMGLE